MTQPEAVILVDQPTLAPTRKVQNGAIAGAIMTIFIGVLKYAGVELPTEMACAALVLVQFGISYVTMDEKQPGVAIIKGPGA